MLLDKIKIGFAMTGSYCTFDKALQQLERILSENAEVYPIISENVSNNDTRFMKAEELKRRLFCLTGKNPIKSIVEAEPIGPGNLLDILVIVPCTGNTLAKLANGITDTTVTMAAKAVLRNKKPVVIAVSSNDGLSANAKNIGVLLNTKNIFFVPFEQDDPVKKNCSTVAKFDMILPAITDALSGKQTQPLLG